MCMYVVVVMINLIKFIMMIIRVFFLGRMINIEVVIVLVNYDVVKVKIIFFEVISFWYWRWREMVRSLFIVMLDIVKNDVEVRKSN